MPTSYSKNKVHIYKWRQNNGDAYRETCRKNQLKYSSWKRIQKIYLSILLD